MKSNQAIHTAERIIEQILLERKNYYDAIKKDMVLGKVKKIRMRINHLVKELKQVFPETNVEIEGQMLV